MSILGVKTGRVSKNKKSTGSPIKKEISFEDISVSGADSVNGKNDMEIDVESEYV
jgi:hypothetical protein